MMGCPREGMLVEKRKLFVVVMMLVFCRPVAWRYYQEPAGSDTDTIFRYWLATGAGQDVQQQYRVDELHEPPHSCPTTSRLFAMLTGHDAVLVAAVAARESRVLATAAAWRQTPMMPAIIARTDHNQALDDDEDDDAVAARGPRCCTRLVPSAVVSRGAHGQHARGAEQASRPRHASRLSYMHNSRVRFWPPPSITSREREFGSAVIEK